MNTKSDNSAKVRCYSIIREYTIQQFIVQSVQSIRYRYQVDLLNFKGAKGHDMANILKMGIEKTLIKVTVDTEMSPGFEKDCERGRNCPDKK